MSYPMSTASLSENGGGFPIWIVAVIAVAAVAAVGALFFVRKRA